MSLDLSSDYFTLFGLPPVFEVDQASLKESFRDLQRKYHPDRFVNAGDRERRESVQAAVLINEAFEVLSNAVPRAQYLLKLAGDETDFDRYTSSDVAFLMEQLEFREELEELPSASDPLAVADAFRARMEGEMQALFTGFSQSLDVQDLDSARNLVSKLKFYQKLLVQLDALEATLEDDLF